jgi:hypothetical protein
MKKLPPLSYTKTTKDLHYQNTSYLSVINRNNVSISDGEHGSVYEIEGIKQTFKVCTFTVPKMDKPIIRRILIAYDINQDGLNYI